MKEQCDARGRTMLSAAEELMDRVFARARANGVVDNRDISSTVNTLLIALTGGKLVIDEVAPPTAIIGYVPIVADEVQPPQGLAQTIITTTTEPPARRGRGPGKKTLEAQASAIAAQPTIPPVVPAQAVPVASAPTPAAQPAPPSEPAKPTILKYAVRHPDTGNPVQVTTYGVLSGTFVTILALCKELAACVDSKGNPVGVERPKKARIDFCEKNGIEMKGRLPIESSASFTEAEANQFIIYLKQVIQGQRDGIKAHLPTADEVENEFGEEPADSATEF